MEATKGPTRAKRPMDPAELMAQLKERALSQGFDLVAVADAGRLERDEATLGEWLKGGKHAGMAWMDRDPEKRSDPSRLLPGCRSVVSLAMGYWPGEQAARPTEGEARVALYARGRDYHKILGKKLKQLAAWLEERSGESARSFVDTGPVLERAWAERSGIGWIGKNANLLTRGMGSWLLIGEILSSVRLESDAGPHEEFCGSCTACLDGCPTAAIVEPGVVDSNRCISYWTIEHRGPIPRDRRGDIADWIFGCDICQEVCPWNESFARAVPPERFGVREDLRGLDPERLLAMDEVTFRALYSGTSLMRAKWEGMRRNACLVLGNRGRADALPALERVLLQDADPVLRGHAAWSIGVIGGDVALQLLRRAVASEGAGEVLEEIRSAIDYAGPPTRSK